MVSQPPLCVAIVGSGPSAMFTAEALLEAAADVEIDIIERLPVPYGLVRYGVAPDHPQTKAVALTFDRLLAHPGVRFHGNLEVGRDVELEDLQRNYDAVVLATGAARDTPLSIPGASLAGIYGSAAFVGWYNGHPDNQGHDTAVVPRGPVTAIVGMGNVALDVARLLASPRRALATTDMTDAALKAIDAAGTRDIYIIGRRGPLDTKFTNPELRELSQLEDVAIVVDMSCLPSPAVAQGNRVAMRNLKTFWDFGAATSGSAAPRRIHFVFNATPLECLGSDRVSGLRLALQGGESRIIACSTLVAAIGYRSAPIPGVPFDPDRNLIPSDEGLVRERLYAVGWARRGPSGVIGTSKPDGALVARRILTECVINRRAGHPYGRTNLLQHIQTRGLSVVDLDGWKRIDAAERAAARPLAPRSKFSTIADMLAAAHG